MKLADVSIINVKERRLDWDESCGLILHCSWYAEYGTTAIPSQQDTEEQEKAVVKNGKELIAKFCSQCAQAEVSQWISFSRPQYIGDSTLLHTWQWHYFPTLWNGHTGDVDTQIQFAQFWNCEMFGSRDHEKAFCCVRFLSRYLFQEWMYLKYLWNELGFVYVMLNMVFGTDCLCRRGCKRRCWHLDCWWRKPSQCWYNRRWKPWRWSSETVTSLMIFTARCAFAILFGTIESTRH